MGDSFTPRLIVSIDGSVVKQVPLTKDRTTLGRRPYKDIVVDDLSVSGEHAALDRAEGGVTLEDVGSTNGTYVNGLAIKRQALAHGDIIHIGKYKIQYLAHDEPPAAMQFTGARAPAAPGPRVEVLNGSAAGRQMALTKEVTTIGRAGLSVAAITRAPRGYVLSHVEGDSVATVNGVSAGRGPIALKHCDQIELAGIELKFMDH
jgi:pSer/pThr/pTyr-binding forkhead associated (FHA) protein